MVLGSTVSLNKRLGWNEINNVIFKYRICFYFIIFFKLHCSENHLIWIYLLVFLTRYLVLFFLSFFTCTHYCLFFALEKENQLYCFWSINQEWLINAFYKSTLHMKSTQKTCFIYSETRPLPCERPLFDATFQDLWTWNLLIYFWWDSGLVSRRLCSDRIRQICKVLLMKVFSHPGHGYSKCCIVSNWTRFSFLQMFHFPSKRLLQY